MNNFKVGDIVYYKTYKEDLRRIFDINNEKVFVSHVNEYDKNYRANNSNYKNFTLVIPISPIINTYNLY